MCLGQLTHLLGRGRPETLVVLDRPARRPVRQLLPLLVLRQRVERLHAAALGHLQCSRRRGSMCMDVEMCQHGPWSPACMQQGGTQAGGETVCVCMYVCMHVCMYVSARVSLFPHSPK